MKAVDYDDQKFARRVKEFYNGLQSKSKQLAYQTLTRRRTRRAMSRMYQLMRTRTASLISPQWPVPPPQITK